MSTPRPNPAHATPRPDPPHTTHPLHGTPRPDQSHFTPRPGPPHVTPTTRPRARKENLFEKWVQSTIKSSHRRVTQQPATSIITVNIATATPVTVNTVAATPNTVAATPNTVAATPVVDTVKLNLEAQLNDASDCPTSHTNKHIPTSTTNFYEIEEELLKLQWHRVCIEDGESQGRCDPLATLLNQVCCPTSCQYCIKCYVYIQHYFVPVSQSSVEQNFL